MVEPAELWTFALANLITFTLGLVLTGLSCYAYSTGGRRRSFRNATVGFGLLTLGMAVEPIYQFGVRGDYHLGGRELLALQTVEGLLLAAGLGMLFYSIYWHNRGSRRSHTVGIESVQESDDEMRW